jgi:thioredoxin 1
MNVYAKVAIATVLMMAIGAVVIIKNGGTCSTCRPGPMIINPAEVEGRAENTNAAALPRLVELGSTTCIPCKMMKPILDELTAEYAGRLEVVFIDVNRIPEEADKYAIRVIPTQVFLDASGKELFRHEGFYPKEDILAKWTELGVNLADATSTLPAFERLVPAEKDARPKEQICYMCDGNINLNTLVTVNTEKGDVRLCGLHCYFIMYSCLTEDKTDFEKKVTVADFVSAEPAALSDAVFLSGIDMKGRPVLRAYAALQAAEKERQASGGNLIGQEALKQNELSHRCGFCDRACYPQDAAEVIVDGTLHTWGCCSHCALGVAARTGKDIEVREKDRLTGETIVVKTFSGSIASLEPKTAVAWFGRRQKPDGTWASAGCFHQGFFTTAENLKKWVEQNPYETGKLISIHQALADKMKLSPEQIQKACKIGECSPK